MKIAGSAILHATPDKVWAAINDPAVLAGVIPGCDAFTELGPGNYQMTVSLGVAAIRGTYTGEVALSDLVEPQSLTMRASGAGAAGVIDTTVAVRLRDVGDGTTELTYDADATVGGMVGGVGQRVLTSVAKKTAAMFFAAIDDVLTGKRAPSAVAGSAPAGSAPAALAQGAATGGVGARGLGVGGLGGGGLGGGLGVGGGPGFVAGAIFGAITMAVGVLVGNRIARSKN